MIEGATVISLCKNFRNNDTYLLILKYCPGVRTILKWLNCGRHHGTQKNCLFFRAVGDGYIYLKHCLISSDSNLNLWFIVSVYEVLQVNLYKLC